MNLKTDIFIFALILSFFCMGCGTPDYPDYSEFSEVPGGVMHRNQWFDFQTSRDTNFHIDADARYDVSLTVRNTTSFNHQILWLAAEWVNYRDSIMTDTIGIRLALPSGEWTGKGSRNIRTSEKIIASNISLPEDFSISFSQAMKENDIVGINDIGLIIRRSTH